MPATKRSPHPKPGARNPEPGARSPSLFPMSAATETITIPVGGMTCAACQAHVQRALNRQPGVRDASVSLMLNQAAVRYDPNLSTPESLVEAIRETGYDATLPSET